MFYKGILVLIMLLPSLSYAANDYVGKVASIKADGGIILVILKDGTGNSGCGNSNSFWLDPKLDFDKAILSLAITAKAAEREVYALGGGECKSGWPHKNSHKLSAFSLR
ncbi:hypothetical protein [Aliikangiella maris]|uniref:Uncharacterized protein n=2 Tax=Aliikangiella maris TaxID=3162458 RepID=A0ABV3MRB4_9GAMM